MTGYEGANAKKKGLLDVPSSVNIIELTKQQLKDAVLIVRYIFGRISNFLHKGSWPYYGKRNAREYLA